MSTIKETETENTQEIGKLGNFSVLKINNFKFCKALFLFIHF